jgi:methionine sulfoxide reductase heme-binding subunit
VRSLNNPAVWYLMRGSGVVTLILFTAVVVLGIATTRRFRAGRMPRFVTLALHRSVSLLAVVFLGIHIATAVADPYAKVGLTQVLVPVPSAKYGIFLGLGALSLDLLVAVMVTSLLRHRLSRRIWKGIHWFAYASWPIAFFHSVGIGTDKTSGWFADTAAVCAGLVAAAIFWRLLDLRRPYPKFLGAPS